MEVRKPFLGARGEENEKKIRQQNENGLVDTEDEPAIARWDGGRGVGEKMRGSRSKHE